MSSMRGLTMFISDIRSCQNKEAEVRRVEKEMAKIREKFSGNKTLSGYDRKKYVWKMLYMHMLGYEVDFGHQVAIGLMSSTKFSEKYAGYMSAILLVKHSSEYFKNAIYSIRSDLISGIELFQSLALALVAHNSNEELMLQVDKEVANMAIRYNSQNITKKSLACLTRLYKQNKSLVNSQQWAPHLTALLDNKSPGLLLATCGLLETIITQDGVQDYVCTQSKLINIITRLVMNKDVTNDYLYYGTPAPWLQVKILKLLQSFNPPTGHFEMQNISDVLYKILTRTEVTKSVNKNNSDHGVLFEAINLIIKYRNSTLEVDLQNKAKEMLNRFIAVKEPNVRYLGLEGMTKLADGDPNPWDLINGKIEVVMVSLRDNDICIRRRALDLLYCITTQDHSQFIVEELLFYLEQHANYDIKEELVLKIAIIAEKFATDFSWYIDVAIRLIILAGDFVSNDVWFRIVQVVTGFGEESNANVQKYAALKVFNALQNTNVHEMLVKLGAYILAEFGVMLQDVKQPYELFEALQKHVNVVSNETLAMLISSFAKFLNNFPELQDYILPIFDQFATHWDADVQQRCVEYLNLAQQASLRQGIFEPMPCYKEEIKSNNILLRRMAVITQKNYQQNDQNAPQQTKQFQEMKQEDFPQEQPQQQTYQPQAQPYIQQQPQQVAVQINTSPQPNLLDF